MNVEYVILMQSPLAHRAHHQMADGLVVRLTDGQQVATRRLCRVNVQVDAVPFAHRQFQLGEPLAAQRVRRQIVAGVDTALAHRFGRQVVDWRRNNFADLDRGLGRVLRGVGVQVVMTVDGEQGTFGRHGRVAEAFLVRWAVGTPVDMSEAGVAQTIVRG
jgi:hypothetical protein